MTEPYWPRSKSSDVPPRKLEHMNALAIALSCREAMREHRKDKPIAFQPRTRP